MISLRPLSFILFVILLPATLCLAFHFVSRFLARRHPRGYRVIALSETEFIIQTRFFPCYWHFFSATPTLQEAFIRISVQTRLSKHVFSNVYKLANEINTRINKTAENVLKRIKINV